MKALRSWLPAAVLLGIAGTGAAQIPALPDIPTALPAAAARPLEAKRTQLDIQRKAVLDSGARHNQRCSTVKEGSADHSECLASHARLNGRHEMAGRIFIGNRATRLQNESCEDIFGIVDVGVFSKAHTAFAERAGLIFHADPLADGKQFVPVFRGLRETSRSKQVFVPKENERIGKYGNG